MYLKAFIVKWISKAAISIVMNLNGHVYRSAAASDAQIVWWRRCPTIEHGLHWLSKALSVLVIVALTREYSLCWTFCPLWRCWSAGRNIHSYVDLTLPWNVGYYRKVNKIGLSTPSSLHLDEYVFISPQLPIAFFETDAIMSVATSCYVKNEAKYFKISPHCNVTESTRNKNVFPKKMVIFRWKLNTKLSKMAIVWTCDLWERNFSHELILLFSVIFEIPAELETEGAWRSGVVGHVAWQLLECRSSSITGDVWLHRLLPLYSSYAHYVRLRHAYYSCWSFSLIVTSRATSTL